MQKGVIMETLAESLERIAKWLRADQEGRLVELPVNMGTECWIVVGWWRGVPWVE